MGTDGEVGEWVLLSYRLPREPSTPRITVWRKLKKLGVAQLSDGVVALPADARTREQFEWLAEEVTESGGQAGVWVARPTTAAQQRQLAAEMAEARADEYRSLTEAAIAAHSDGGGAAAVKRLRTRWREITRRDFFPPPEREQARQALRTLTEEALPRGDEQEARR